MEQLLKKKRELNEKEKMIKKELEKLADVRGTIVPKIINDCGPYYYLVYREGGKMRWIYLGKTYPKDLARKLQLKRELIRELNKIKKEKEEISSKINAKLLFGSD